MENTILLSSQDKRVRELLESSENALVVQSRPGRVAWPSQKVDLVVLDTGKEDSFRALEEIWDLFQAATKSQHPVLLITAWRDAVFELHRILDHGVGPLSVLLRPFNEPLLLHYVRHLLYDCHRTQELRPRQST